jgi:hypothetical protein
LSQSTNNIAPAGIQQFLGRTRLGCGGGAEPRP